MERLRSYDNWREMEEGELTHPPRTIVEIIIHVLERVADIVGTLIGIIVRTIIWNIKNVIADVAEFVSKYFNDGDRVNDGRKKKGILWCIFFSSLTRKNAFIISCIAVSIDPLFFYIPVIDEKNNCLGIDKRLRTVALWLRALPDAAFALQTINSVFRIFKRARAVDCSEILLLSFMSILIGAFLIHPIPQVRD
ncbi:hypothetical protein CerSpe_146600 [Prunus speciosa]